MDKIIIKKKDEVYLSISASDSSIYYDLTDKFSFYAEGYKYHKLFKNKVWDGKIRLFNPMKKVLYIGLLNELKRFCEDREIEMEIDPKLTETGVVTKEELEEWCTTFPISVKGELTQPYDYQLEVVAKILTEKRFLGISPTSSGKSLILYLAIKWLVEKGKSCILIVPDLMLIKQMEADFRDYSSLDKNFNMDDYIHTIYSGKEKISDKPIQISTWQSCYTLNENWFNCFDAIFVDEVHKAKSKSITGIMEKCTEVVYRAGVTGSIDFSTNIMSVTGMFSEPYRVKTTRELMDEGKVSPLKIKGIILNYPDNERTLLKGAEYKDEMNFLMCHDRRNKFIKNLVLNIEGNTLVLCAQVKKHVDVLYEMLVNNSKGKKVYRISGSVEADERERIRQIVDKEDDCIIIASYSTMSTGVSIRKLNNIVFGSPLKSFVRVLQSIGRGLRMITGKEFCTLYDIGDDLKKGGKKNHALNHFIERLGIYISEEFEYKTIEKEI